MTQTAVAPTPTTLAQASRTRCRSCGSDGLRAFLDLGRLPLSDNTLSLADLDAAEPRHELTVAFCPTCTLVQILQEVDPRILFVDNYLYFSSYSDTLLEHSREHAQSLMARRGLDENSFVVELASNDGYLLQNFTEAGIPVLGVDPAPNQARVAEERGVPTMREFFGLDLARRIRAEHGPADVIIANNVMAHVPDLNDFVGGMAWLVADDGVITVENPYVRDLIERCAFDTIYHEHFYYYSCTAVDRLAARHGLRLVDVEYFPDLHAGTLRWHLAKTGTPSRAVRDYLSREALGLATFQHYEDFAATVADSVERLRALLETLKFQGATIAAYGAAAKGAILLNVAEIDATLVDYVVDRNPYKAGRFMPGVHLPIRPVEALTEDRPDYTVILAWNFAREIVEQQDDYVDGGGKFILPLPRAQVL